MSFFKRLISSQHMEKSRNLFQSFDISTKASRHAQPPSTSTAITIILRFTTTPTQSFYMEIGIGDAVYIEQRSLMEEDHVPWIGIHGQLLKFYSVSSDSAFHWRLKRILDLKPTQALVFLDRPFQPATDLPSVTMQLFIKQPLLSTGKISSSHIPTKGLFHEIFDSIMKASNLDIYLLSLEIDVELHW